MNTNREPESVVNRRILRLVSRIALRHRSAVFLTFLLSLVPTVLAPTRAVAAPPADFAVEDVITGLEQPMTIRFLPDGRMLLLLKKGKILIADVSSVPASFELYLDLAATSHADGIKADQERGLIDIAIDPNFPTSPYIYLFYTPQRGPDGQRSRIARFTHVNNSGGLTSRANPASEVILWQDTEGYDSCCHFGGGLDFGPDGKLWLTVGDHFQGSYAASVEHAGGSVHRINKNGTIPADNPYADGAGPNVDSLFAIGLRNPFRARWDLPTGRFFIAEVGGNTQAIAWEDLHVIRYDADTATFIDADWGTAQDNFRYDGINFGWPTVEGLPPHNDFPGWSIDPVVGEPIFAYRHAGTTAAINGGVVYRKTQFPTAYRNAYFYADSTRDFVRYLKLDSNGEVIPNPNPGPITPDNPDSISHAFDLEPLGRIVCLEVGPDGSLYYVSFTDSGGAYGQPNPSVLGAVRRYVYGGGNSWPVISEFSVTPTSGPSPLNASFRIRAQDPESQPMTYTISFGDGTTWGPLALPANTNVNVPHTYAADGAYTARVDVSDGVRTTSQPLPVPVGTPPVITLLTSDNPRSGASDTMFRFGDTITFTANATDAEDGTLPASRFTWAIDFVRPGNTHPTFGPESGTKSITFPIPNQGQGFSDAVYYRCFLTVTDSSGLTTSAHIDIFPEKSDITFNTTPSGINIQVDGNTSRPAPFVMDSLVNYDHLITAPETQCLNGTQYVFSHWSNGPTTPQQVFTVPPTNVSLTAVYTSAGACAAPPSSGLVLHLRSDLGVVTSSGRVQAWEDQSGNNNVLSAVGEPTLVNNLAKGRPAIRFDGVDDALSRTGLVGFPAAAADRSMFMVVRYLSAGSGNGWVGFTYGTAASNQAFGLTLTSAGILGVQGWGSTHDTLSNPQTGGPGEWLLQGAVYSGGVLTQYKNGTAIGTRTKAFATVPSLLRLGEELNGGKNMNMEVAEILVYNRALTAQERSTVTQYLTDRYIGPAGPSNTAPNVSITAPTSGTSHVEGTTVAFTATATDAEDGNLGSSISWSSSRDGSLGTGASLSRNNLSVGTHTITASVSDSGALTDTDSITLTITAAPTGGPPTNGLVLHLRSDAGVTRTGSRVTAWQDQSSSNNHLSAVGDPQYNATLANGRPAVRFDGVDDALARTGFSGLSTGAANRTVYLVTRYNGTGTTGNGWAGFAYGSPAQNQTFGLTINPTGILGVQGWGGSNDTLSSPPTSGLGSWLVHSALLSGNQLTQYLNGSAIGSATRTYATGTQGIRLGEEINGGRNVPMDVAEILVYNRALTAQERATVTQYLAARYIGSSGPSNTAPNVSITAPTSGTSHVEGTTVAFTATATDAEDGNLGSSISWSSSRDGSLGTGASLSRNNLSVGTHTITASVSDSGALTDSDSITLTITAAPTGGPPTNGLVLHLRSDAGVTRTGSRVTAWQDQSSSNNHLNAVGDPQYDATLANGRPAVRFDGVDDALARTGFSGLSTGAANRTVYLVTRYNGTGTTGNGWAGFAYGSPTQNQTFGLTINPTGILGVQGWGGSNDTLSSPSTSGLGSWLVHSALLSGNQLTQYLNGSPIGSATHTYATGTQGIRLGEEINGGRNVPMDVAEILVYNRALTTQERGTVDAYLASRYAPGTPPPPPDDDPITPTQPIALFNGTSLNGLYPWFKDSGATDPNQVYRIQNGLLRVTGNGWGGLITEQSYRNYQAVLEFKFGPGTFGPRVGAAKDAGLCIHSNGPDGGWQDLLIPHLQVQIMEGAIGDLMALPQTVGGGSNPVAVSFRSRHDRITCESGNSYCRGGYVYDPSGSLRTFSGNLATQHWFGFDPDWSNVTGFRGDVVVESPDGEWNQLVVVANGDDVSVYLNGTLINAATDVTPEAGKLQLEVEWAEYFVRRWELLPLGTPVGPAIVNETLPSATAGSSYSTRVKAVGGTSPLTWSVSSGSLPGGLTLNTSNGTISGTPTAAGTSTFTVRVVDSGGRARTQQFQLVVQPGSSSGGLPTDGLVLQLESDLNVALLSGTTVAGWLDQSGWGNDLVSKGNPQLAASGTPSGRPAIRFDGVNDSLTREHATSALGGLPIGNANRSIFAVVKYNGPATVGTGVSYGTGAQNRAFGLMVRKTSGELALQGWGGSYDLSSTQPGVGAGWLVQSGILNNGQARLYRNGTQIAQRSGTYDTSLTRLVIGEEIKGLGYLNMEVAAVLIYNRALNATDHAAVVTYLTNKYMGSGN